MQIVIDIPNDIYKKILSDRYVIYDKIYYSIRNGTPLPQGHGRLIDADELDRKMKAYNSGRGFYYSGLPYARTIIEADTESEEKG